MTIDLSQFVGKKVRVTFRNGETYKGKITFNEFYDSNYFPYRFVVNKEVYFKSFTVTGTQSTKYSGNFDIMKIEEINEIKELEKQVAEMQKEIDRLKAQEQKEVPKIRCIEVTRTIDYDPKIRCIEVTRTIDYDPESYLESCEECGVTPTQEGFIDYIAMCFDEDFWDVFRYNQEIKQLEVWND